jgi:hypothetical protein
VKGSFPRSCRGIGSGFLFLPSATCVVRVVVVPLMGEPVRVLVCARAAEVVGGPCGLVVVDDAVVAPAVEVVLEVGATAVVVVDVVLDVDELLVVVVCDVDLTVVVDDVAVVLEQSRKLPLSFPFEPFPWLSSQFPWPPPLCTQGSPPKPGAHSGAVSVSPRRSLPALVFVAVVDGGALSPAAAIAASVPAVKIAAARVTDSRAFFMGD